MPRQVLLFTPMTRGVALNPEVLPISVVVFPRLFDGSRLREFPDWLHWTERLANDGLELTFESGARRVTIPIAAAGLRRDLWEGIFKPDTLVRPYVFDDYSERAVFSYPERQALSALKGIYQAAALDLALPERGRAVPEPRFEPDRFATRRERANRTRLKSYLRGLAVNWTDDRRAVARERIRRARPSGLTPPALSSSQIGRDGLIATAHMPEPGSADSETFNRAVADPFGAYHHMPLPDPPGDLPEPDWKNLFDFHQALGSLQNYSALQRALGLVFDLELPGDFFGGPAGDAVRTLAVTGAEPGWQWDVPTETRPLATSVVHADAGEGQRAFFTAPAGVVSGSNDIEIFGLLNLDATRYGLAQVDIDGGMHKLIMLAETLHGDPKLAPATPPHAEVFDSSNTLPSLRSGGLSLFADGRALALMQRFMDAKALNAAIESGQQQRPFNAEDLVRGYRLDIWDSGTAQWHSLHRRDADYVLGNASLQNRNEEGFVKLLATQAAPDPRRQQPADDFYLRESIARWAGWSLSVSLPGKHLSRYGDPDKAFPRPGQEAQFVENEPKTPFKMTTAYRIRPGTLPRLRFGTRYRLRARAVDLAGNSIGVEDEVTALLSATMALPPDADGFAYLRFEPVAAPIVVLRDPRGVTLPGSELERLVIRTFNENVSLDGAPADRAGNDRHIAPPRIGVEGGERHGMFDDQTGKPIATQEMYELISRRDRGEFRNSRKMEVAGKQDVEFPLEPNARLDDVPYLPDPLARGAAFRDLPGAPDASRGTVGPGVGSSVPVTYRTLDDPNPRRGSATLVDFGGDSDWQQRRPFRFALEEGDGAPTWDPIGRVLSVYLAKGLTRVVPLSSFIAAGDLKLMGVWEWLREYLEFRAARDAKPEILSVGEDVDAIAHVLQRSVEGGHWMLTPPRLLTLVHAVQQPVGIPRFTALAIQHLAPSPGMMPEVPLETEPETFATRSTETAAITAWRRNGAVDAYLLGGLYVHAASTARIDLAAAWEDPVDDPDAGPPGTVVQSAHIDQIPLGDGSAQYLAATGSPLRLVGYVVPDRDLIAFVKQGDALGNLAEGTVAAASAAPRHHLSDTRHHVVRYVATATSRYRDYFPQDLDFTRRSEPVEVDVPASARPQAPRVAYVIPAFGWQRETSTSLKRSVRHGGGLRVYLERPWFSSGAGELLGVVLWHQPWPQAPLDRQAWKPFITQWGVDPIWDAVPPWLVPVVGNFTGFETWTADVTLEENTPATSGTRGTVDVVGYRVQFDGERNLWYSDIILTTAAPTYMPFVRLALARFQPHALKDAMLSRVVLGDFVQLTPDRSALATADPSHPRRIRLTVSGPAPWGPRPEVANDPPPGSIVTSPTAISVSLLQRHPAIASDLAWSPAPLSVATVVPETAGPVPGKPYLTLWSGTILFAEPPADGRFRILIEEHEYVSSNYTTVIETPGERDRFGQPGRLIYAETIDLDTALVAAPTQPTDGTGETAPAPAWPEPKDAPYGSFAGRPEPEASDVRRLPELERTNDAQSVDGHVKLLQALLNAAGARPPSLQPLAVDGNFGPNTEAALIAFQTTRLMPDTGTTDPMTWYALLLAAPFAQLEAGAGDPPMQGPPIAIVQQLLNLAGVFPRVNVSGAYDEDTETAIGKFQEERGLAQTLVTDLATWLALGQVPEDTAPTGSMTLTFAYDVTAAEPIKFISRVDSDASAPESDSIDWAAVGSAGYVVELHDVNGQAIYRRTLRDPFRLTVEYSRDDRGKRLSVSAVPPSPGTLVLVLPVLARVSRVVFICSPLDAARMYEPAAVLASFDITR